MAKSTDYGLFTKAHPETGKEMRRAAGSPAEAVRLKFDGWAEQAPQKTTRSATPPATSKPAASSN
ncbi:hypothetical protein [Micromonospora arborensis]|uniref:hypothetical protein n=1 Tax=Micromonospora arborensis TaxID=2116518 RepID=UPI00371941DE